MSLSVAVTGGGGFIGTTLIRKLLLAGTRVSRLVRPTSTAAKSTHPLYDHHGIPDSAEGFAALLGRLAPDAVINLATYGVSPSEGDPETMLDANLGSLTRLLLAAGGTKTRIVHVGSCSEYAPIQEPERLTESSPCHPTSPYGAAKLAASEWGRALSARAGVPFVTLRLFGVYGAGEAPHRIIPYVSTRLRRGEPADLTTGTQVRDLTYVDDVADALILASRAELEPGAIYNVCSGVGVSIREVCERVCRRLGASQSLLRFGAQPLRPGEQAWVVGDPARFLAASGWSARTPLEQGVELTLAGSQGSAA